MDIRLRDIGVEDVEALAHVGISANISAFRGLVPDQCLTFTEAESAANWRAFFREGLSDGDFMTMAASDTGEMMGYAWGGPRADDPIYYGELRQIMIHPAYQRQGIGRALVRHVARRLAAQGIHSMLVEVLQINPNRPFYERLGGQFVYERPYDWDGVIFTMYAYGWADTRPLCQMV